MIGMLSRTKFYEAEVREKINAVFEKYEKKFKNGKSNKRKLYVASFKNGKQSKKKKKRSRNGVGEQKSLQGILVKERTAANCIFVNDFFVHLKKWWDGDIKTIGEIPHKESVESFKIAFENNMLANLKIQVGEENVEARKAALKNEVLIGKAKLIISSDDGSSSHDVKFYNMKHAVLAEFAGKLKDAGFSFNISPQLQKMEMEKEPNNVFKEKPIQTELQQLVNEESKNSTEKDGELVTKTNLSGENTETENEESIEEDSPQVVEEKTDDATGEVKKLETETALLENTEPETEESIKGLLKSGCKNSKKALNLV